MLPPETTHPDPHVLFMIVTFDGAAVNVGQDPQLGVNDKLSNPNSSLDPEPPTSAPDHLKYI